MSHPGSHDHFSTLSLQWHKKIGLVRSTLLEFDSALTNKNMTNYYISVSNEIERYKPGDVHEIQTEKTTEQGMVFFDVFLSVAGLQDRTTTG